MDESALSDVERIKRESHGLRGTLGTELENESTHVTHDAERILKFHGSYMQEDRDQRRERKKAGLEPAYQFMVRSKLPGGVMNAEQYLVQDALADRYGNGTLRITTRQGFQFHGVLKGDLRPAIRDLNEALVTTFGACGDVVRNVVACPAPIAAGVQEEVIEWARRLKDETLPTTSSYHEIWIEGVSVTRPEQAEPDPLYQERYLPRKFKIGFGFPEDNCNDVHSNDLGYLVIAEDGRLEGFNVLVGGGLGQTHGKSETFPRLALPLAFVTPEELIEVSKAVIAVQRDYGNRVSRKRARLKYLIEERGLDWFREQVEAQLGRKLVPAREVEITGIHDHLGWHKQGDGRWFRGVWVENGRILDREGLQLRTALRTLVERLGLDVHLTTQHNVLLVNIAEDQKAEVDRVLAEHGVVPIEALTPTRRWGIACPALPTCGLAVAESERVHPALVTELEGMLAELGLAQEDLTVRMTGCPNGCARPYTADLAFVGRSLGKYVVFVGGSFLGTRLATAYADLVPFDRIVPTVRPLFERYRDDRLPGERFGDYWDRVGVEPIQAAGARA
ncbi:MAG: NADPH-dependent assimilatory sulfite reductase hemoprotein subunit [Gemmatimonadetes bacterium]|nr:NADPH-dependent assimilatory sulfite reductase hemoprotein subunit [Gemmatimonadota bacterium]